MKRTAFGILFLVACMPACGPSDPAPSTKASLDIELPTDFADLDAPIRVQFEKRHETLDRVLHDSEAPGQRRAKAYGAVGEIHFAYNHLESAEEAFRQAVELAPLEPRWVYLLARVQQDLGLTEASDEGLRRVLELMSEHTPSRLILADRAAQAGEAALAATELEEVLRLDPANAKARVGLATLALQANQPQAALEHIQEALARQPSAAPLHYQAALILRQLGDLESAQRHLARVPAQNVTQIHLVTSDPWMNEIEQLRIGARHHDQRAMRHLAAGRYELAIVELRQALAANPDRIYARHGLGAAMAQLGRTEEALGELRTLIEQAPNHVPSLVLMARILLEVGRSDEATVLIDQALLHDPEDASALRLLAGL